MRIATLLKFAVVDLCSNTRCKRKHAVPPCDAVIAGSPCQDWSRAGHMRGISGTRSLVFLTFCRLLMEDQPPWGILENVIGFDTNLLIDLIGGVYSVYTLVVSPQDHGFNLVRRDRLYMVLVHRRKASMRHDLHAMYGSVSGALSRKLHTVVADCVLAKDTEVIADTAALAQRRKRLHKHGNKNQELHLTSDEKSRKRKLSAMWVELILS